MIARMRPSIRTTRPSIVAMFIAVYWDLNRVRRALWRPALVAFLALIALHIAIVVAARSFAMTYAVKTVLIYVMVFGGLLAIAPFLIAMQRFIVLGEVSQRYAIALADPRFQLFAGWLLVLGLIASFPSLVDVVAAPVGVTYYRVRPPELETSMTVARLLVLTGVFGALARLAILLPAVAVDAPGATWQSAFADTRGQTGYIMWTTIVISLPLLPALALLSYLARQISGTVPGLIAAFFVLATMLFATVVLAGVIAARLYQAFGDRLDQRSRG